MVKGGRENWCGFFHQVFRGITGKKGRPGLAALPVISGRYLRARHPGSPVRYDPDQDQRAGPSPGHHARSVHRTVIACAGQKSLHKKHMQQSWLFSGYTPSPLIDTKTPIEQRSTHRCFAWQWRDRLQRSGSTYTSVPTVVAGPTSTKEHLLPGPGGRPHPAFFLNYSVIYYKY